MVFSMPPCPSHCVSFYALPRSVNSILLGPWKCTHTPDKDWIIADILFWGVSCLQWCICKVSPLQVQPLLHNYQKFLAWCSLIASEWSLWKTKKFFMLTEFQFLNLPQPEDLKVVQRFPSFKNYYRHFIKVEL